MPQGQAVDVRERQFVVQLKEYFDQERRQGPTVSTQDAVGRVAQALGLGKRTVKEILRTYRQTGQVATATLDAKGKPGQRPGMGGDRGGAGAGERGAGPRRSSF